MLKPKKGFVQAQLNIERLTPIQWDGIMRAMDAYAKHYHEEQVKKLNIPAVIKSVCDCGRREINVLSGICDICWNEKFPNEQTVL